MSKPIKWQLSCCALCQMTAGNDTPLSALEYMVEKTKAESEEVWNPNDRRSGERAIFTIVAPGEYILEQNLIHLGFTMIQKFNRRNGYPNTGQLKMYFLHW